MYKKMLERKVNALIDYVTCPEWDAKRKNTLLTELLDLRNKVNASPEKTAKFVAESLLTELGVPSRLSGYYYAVTAIQLIVEDPSLKNSITHKLYPKVAEIHNATPPSVERCIRHAIEVFCERGDIAAIHKFFGNAVSSFKGKPTNTEFICRFAQLVEHEMG